MPKPNIVFIFTDQMRATAMGCAGVEKVNTPNLDHFATQGARFTRAISNTPICTPARATILSGLHVLGHQLVCNDKQLRTDLRSIAHCLNDDGYRCGYIGKWHLDSCDRGVFVPPGPRRQGFDDYWAAANCNHHYLQAYYYENDNPDPVWIDGYEPDAQADLAVDYINSRSAADDPFCLFLSWGTPHCPYHEMPQKYLDMYSPDDVELLPNVSEDNVNKTVISNYYGHITALDEYFGRIMKSIDDAGIADDTIVVFTSDHGDMMFSQGRGWKCKPWAESVGIPLIMRWPGHIPAGRTTAGPISLVDMMPTLLSMADVDIPAEVQGENAAAFVQGNDAAGADSVFINLPLSFEMISYDEWRGIVTRTHTYARFRDKVWVLYDDANDPFQLDNLAESPDHQDLRDELEAVLQQWLDRTDDAFESSPEIAAKYFPEAGEGIIDFWDSDIILKGKAARGATWGMDTRKK